MSDSRKVQQIKSARRKKTEVTLGEAFPNLIPPEAQTIKLPEGYLIKGGALYEAREDGSCVTATPILPVKRIQDLDSEMNSLQVMIIFREGLRYVTIPAQDLADQRRILSLANQGVDVATPTANRLVKFLQSYNRLNHLPTMYQTSRLGYRPIGEAKVYLLHQTYPHRSDLSFRNENEIELKRQWATQPHGKLADWSEVMFRVLPYPKVVIGILASLAPALRELLKLDTTNFILHYNAPSSTGKTVAQKIALSVWADPEAEGWRIHGHATFAGTEALCLRTNGLPVILEDCLLMREDDRRQLIYAVGNEQFKARGGKQTRTQWPWHGVILTSGEGSLVGEDSPTGEAARTIQLNGLPFRSHSEQIRALIDNEILPTIRDNYALLGPKLLEFLLSQSQEDINQLRAMFVHAREQWARKAQGHFLLARQSSQWTTLHLTASILVALLSREHEKPMLEALDICFEECRSEPKPSPIKRAHELLTSSILANKVYCYTPGETSFNPPARQGTVVGVINRNENWVASYRNFAESELKRHGYSNPTRIFRALRDEGLLRSNIQHLTYPIRIQGQLHRMIWLWLPDEKPGEEAPS